MKIFLKGKFSKIGRDMIRRCGYGEIRDYRSGETSYARRLSSGFYPRFHLYINNEGPDETVLNLHLDQRQTRYEGQTAHSGEYDGELVENEARRIKDEIRQFAIESGSNESKAAAPDEEGFWKKFWQKLG